jgi:hypothetical protein
LELPLVCIPCGEASGGLVAIVAAIGMFKAAGIYNQAVSHVDFVDVFARL